MKRIIFSLAMIVAVGAGVVGATGAFFSDTETSTGNTFTAGAIDLRVDSEQHYNGNVCVDGLWVGNAPWPVDGTECGGTWGQVDSAGDDIDGLNIIDEKFFNLDDLKPGDWGENTISLHVDSNDAWACAKVTITSDEDVTCVDPEEKAEGDGVCVEATTDAFNGEMRESLSLAWWADDGDNILEDDERSTLFFQSGLRLSDILLAGGPDNNALYLTLADSDTNFFTGTHNGNDVPMTGGETAYVGFAWCFGDFNDLTQAGALMECNGGPIGNEAQTDSLTADLEFTVIQARHNEDFECADTYRLDDVR